MFRECHGTSKLQPDVNHKLGQLTAQKRFHYIH